MSSGGMRPACRAAADLGAGMVACITLHSVSRVAVKACGCNAVCTEAAWQAGESAAGWAAGQAAAFKWAAVQPPCAGRPWTPASHSAGGSAHTVGGGPPSRALWGLRGRAERRGARRKRALRVPVGPRGSIAAGRAPAAC